MWRGFSANGALYVVGGTDGTKPQSDVWWTTPDATGAITGWKHLSQSDWPAGGIAGGSAVASGSFVYVIGGAGSDGVTNGARRANLAPKPPFFQVGGPFGLTIPALKIDGAIGQQVGYLNAAGVATVDFVLLILAGWALAHKDKTREIVARIRRRREHCRLGGGSGAIRADAPRVRPRPPAARARRDTPRSAMAVGA